MIKRCVENWPEIISIVINSEQLEILKDGENKDRESRGLDLVKNLDHLKIDGKTYKLKVCKHEQNRH